MAKSRKGGRQRKTGDRFPCGKLRSAHDYGNDRVIQLEAQFAPFQGGKAGPWVRTSAIGRAWAVGLLDGWEADAAAIRDAGLSYASRYWGNYPTASGTSNYGGEDKRGSSWGDGEDPRGLRFIALDNAIRKAGRDACCAVHNLVIDHYWFPLDNEPWLDRLINERLRDKRRHVAGQLPRHGDAQALKLAIDGLLMIVAGTVQRRAA